MLVILFIFFLSIAFGILWGIYTLNKSLASESMYNSLLYAEKKLYKDIGNDARIRLYKQKVLNSMKEKEETIKIEQNHALFRTKARRS